MSNFAFFALKNVSEIQIVVSTQRTPRTAKNEKINRTSFPLSTNFLLKVFEPCGHIPFEVLKACGDILLRLVDSFFDQLKPCVRGFFQLLDTLVHHVGLVGSSAGNGYEGGDDQSN